MSSPFVGEIRMFAGNFNPNGWALCQGQLMAISQNEVLFNLIGTTYGGDGQSTFALPDLQGRFPIHQGTSTTGTTYQIGEKAGVETVTLTTNTIPIHSHIPLCNGTANSAPGPGGNFWAQWSDSQFTDGAATGTMAAAAVASAGGSQPHENMMPFLVINFIISLFGIFPTQN